MERKEAENMITNRLNEFTLQLSEHLAQTVQGVVKITVNGKIDAMTKILHEQNEQIAPMIKWFNEKIIIKNYSESQLRSILWWAGFISAVGGALIILREFLKSVIMKLV